MCTGVIHVRHVRGDLRPYTQLMVVLLTAPADTSGYTLLIAEDASDVAAAQRLRHRVFADEFGATPDSAVPGHDVDYFDDFCDHLIIRDNATNDVVGTYRLLRPEQAAGAGRRYGDDEFDLSPLRALRGQLVEAGRSCVDPAHRSGAVVNLMWAGIARYLHLHGLRWLGGCASVSLADGGMTAAGVRTRVNARHLAPPAWRVTPHRPWAGPGECARQIPPPALLRGYLRLGAWVCGEPAHDPQFNVADFYVLFSMDRLDARYRRHFLGDAP